MAIAILLVAGAKAQTKGAHDAFVLGAAPAASKPEWTLAPLNKRLANPSPARIQTIIQKFTANERTFMQLLAHNYTYTESILVQQMDDYSNPTGSFQQTNSIVYTPGSGRQIVCTYCPQPTLTNFGLDEGDLTDMFNMNMYTFPVDKMAEYNVTYLDHQPVGEITAYVFRIQPKKIVKGNRYFNGIAFVDDATLGIVKSIGRVVPNQYDKHGNPTHIYLPFTVWRKQIDGKYWFPVYERMEGKLNFGQGEAPIPMREVIQFTNYKRFGASSRILSVQAVPQKQKQPDKTKKKNGGGSGGGGNRN
ncbi:MAG: hypothetical protein ACRD0Y_07725 [Terriglobales bacterium]